MVWLVRAYGNTPKEQSLPTHNRKAVANPDGMDNSRPVRTHFLGGYVGDPGLRCAYPGLNPVGIRLRVHVLNGRSLRRDYRNIGSAMPRRQYTTQNIQRGASVNDIRNSAARRRPDRTRAERQRGCSRG